MKTCSSLIAAVAAASLLGALPALATTQTFAGPLAGTVVAGELPGGGTDPGTTFADFTLSVTNHGTGPNTLVIFDSSNPTGDDPDLGTPNADFGGPGIGTGGAAGSGGENSQSWGNLIICQEHLVDANNDGRVDDPDDEAGGCTITFDFDFVADLEYIVFVDIDSETVDYDAFEFGVLMGGDEGVDLGNNSVQRIDLTPFYSVDKLVVDFSSSGAIAEIGYSVAAVPTEKATWGEVKATFR